MVDDRFNNNQSTSAFSWCFKKNIETGMQEQGLGRSKGGFSRKLHAACDARGNPVRFFVTAGQRSDDIKALDVVEGRETDALRADKGYDADYMNYDQELYKERNVIVQ